MSDRDVRKSLQDTGYVVLGLGVLGVEQVRKGARRAGAKLTETRGSASIKWGEARKGAGTRMKSTPSSSRDASITTSTLKALSRTPSSSL